MNASLHNPRRRAVAQVRLRLPASIARTAAAVACCGSLLIAVTRCDEEPLGPAPRDPSSAYGGLVRRPLVATSRSGSIAARKARSVHESAPVDGTLHAASSVAPFPVTESPYDDAIDPGVRPGPAGAGAPDTPQPIDADDGASLVAASAACLATLSDAPSPGEPGVTSGGVQVAGMLEACAQAVIRFQEVNSVSGTLESGVGLGPTYNGNSCASCHSQPAILGAGVSLGSPQRPDQPNPLVALATLHGAKNAVPFFLTAKGPVREARFTTDNAVHDLFTIAGRTDALGCNAAAPDFEAANAIGALRFRIPISTFGDGLVENIADSALRVNFASSRVQFDTGGTFQISPDDGTISRFGWKAQTKSLLAFSTDAYNVELGVTNEGFPNERAGGATELRGCMTFNATPEDTTNLAAEGSTSDVSSDTVNFALAIRLSRPPTPARAPFTIGSVTIGQAEIAEGQRLFATVGCASCHTPSLTTAPSSLDPSLSSVTFHPYSDFALHHIGATLADGITQGSAGGDQFRTAPLWGIGQRQYFLHDGRTNDLTEAIAAHGGDSAKVIRNYDALSASDKQAIVDFMRSL